MLAIAAVSWRAECPEQGPKQQKLSVKSRIFTKISKGTVKEFDSLANSLKKTKLAQLLADCKTLLFFSSGNMKETGIMARNREEQNTQLLKTIFCGYGLTNLYFEAEQNATFSFLVSVVLRIPSVPGDPNKYICRKI